MTNNKPLLSIIELGGYPDLNPLYKKHGYVPIVVCSMRKALAALKKVKPVVIVAEFNYQSDFRDRTSSLESLIAIAQRNTSIKLIVFYEKEHQHQLEKLKTRYEFYAAFTYPIEEGLISKALANLENQLTC